MSTPIWMAFPPEVHSILLSSGPGSGSLFAAAQSWEQLATHYIGAQDEVMALLVRAASSWDGESGQQFLQSHIPLVSWLADVASTSSANAGIHTGLATSYDLSLVSMPTLAELIANHVMHAILVATNFFGVNTIPIALNEADYVRMWIQAAETMANYQGQSSGLLSQIRMPEPPPQLISDSGITSGLIGLLGELAQNSQGALSQEFNDAANIVADMRAMRKHVEKQLRDLIALALGIGISAFTPGTPLDFISHMIIGPILTIAISSPGIIAGVVGGVVGGVGANLVESLHAIPVSSNNILVAPISSISANVVSSPVSTATSAPVSAQSMPVSSAAPPASGTVAANPVSSAPGGLGPVQGYSGTVTQGLYQSFAAAVSSAFTTRSINTADDEDTNEAAIDDSAIENGIINEQILNDINMHSGFLGTQPQTGISDPLGLARMPKGKFSRPIRTPMMPSTWKKSSTSQNYVSTSTVSAAASHQTRINTESNMHINKDKNKDTSEMIDTFKQEKMP